MRSAQITSLTHDASTDPCWTEPRELLLIDVADQLHDTATIDDDTWARAETLLSDAETLDLVALTGWYHAISFLAKGAAVANEPGAPTFADVRPA